MTAVRCHDDVSTSTSNEDIIFSDTGMDTESALQILAYTSYQLRPTLLERATTCLTVERCTQHFI